MNSALHRFLHALIDRLDVFLGHRAADDIVDELVTLAGLVRIEINLGVPAILAAAILPVWRMYLPSASACLRIVSGDTCHLRFADVAFDFELAFHAINDDLEVQLAHAAEDGLSAVGIGVNL